MKKLKEKDLYPILEKWISNYFHCFKTKSNTGLKYSRADIVGVRDVGGDLSGEIETIIVEVKKGTEPFATASGQAVGYKIYGNRIYLADYRENGFSIDEIDIASHLGIGLIKIFKNKCQEVLSSPYHRPLIKHNTGLLEQLHLGKCQICDSFIETGELDKNKFSNMSRENINRAISLEKGLMFWNRELGDRKREKGIRISKDKLTFERRFICPNCIENLFSQFKLI